MASSIILEFNIKLGINFYDIDTKVMEALKVRIDCKERDKNSRSGDSNESSTINPAITQANTSSSRNRSTFH